MSEIFGDLFIQNDEEHLYVSPLQPIPVRGRHSSQLAGLQNRNATCYLNSLLQILYFTTELREGILSLTKQELNLDIPGGKTRKILLELQKLFANLCLRDEDAISTSDLTSSFGWDSDEESCQQDIQELNRVLFSALERCLQGTSKENLIKDLYHGINIQKITCMNCSSISEREEEVFDISVPVKNVSNLEDALSKFYCQSETFQGDNQYHCESCRSYVKANKITKLRKLPKILTLSFLRFSFDLMNLKRYKDVGQLSFPMIIDMKIYCEEDYGNNTEYELYAVVAHSGGTHGGHYRTYIKDIEKLGNYDYEDKTELIYKKKNEDSKLTSPFDIIKEILIDYKDGITTDILATKISTYCGTSWKKKFKNRYGTLRSFLEKNTEFYTDESTKQVRLTERRVQNKKKGGLHETSGWFLLNDSKVEKASIDDIQKLYQGTDSAYMLFYTKTDNKSATKRVIDTIPEWLVLLIKEANRTLAEKRNEYNDSLTLSINIIKELCSSHKGDYVIFYNDLSEAKIEIKLNWTIKNLKREIYNSMINLPTSMENLVFMQIKKTKNIPNVFELENHYNYPDNILLSQTPIYSNCYLALRDCSKSDNIRPDKEIFLKLSSFDSKPVLHQFLADINYEEFLLQTIDLLQISDNEVDVKINGNSKQDDRILSFEDLRRNKISEIFQDFDSILITKEKSIGCIIYLNDKNEEHAITMPQNSTIGELKTITSSSLNISSQKYRFRLKDKGFSSGFGPPLGDSLKLKDLSTEDTFAFLLEEGNSPQEYELFLSVIYQNVEKEIIISKTETLQSLLKLTKTIFNLSVENYHFCHCNIFREIGDPIQYSSYASSLATLDFHDGKRLIIIEGSIPCKDHMHLYLLCTDFSYDGVNESINTDDKNVRPFEITLHCNTTLNRFKKKIAQKLVKRIEHLDYIRCRLIENGKKGLVLKNNDLTLRRLKVTNKSTINIQILKSPECLTQNHVVLTIQVWDQSNFFTLEDFIWNTNGNWSVNSLKDVIGSEIGLSSEKMIIAKYFPKEFRWLILKDNKHCKKAEQNALRVKPILLRDGDVLKIKFGNEKEINPQDFLTSYDVTELQKIEVKLAEKRKQKEAIENFHQDVLKSNKKETGITIKIDGFED